MNLQEIQVSVQRQLSSKAGCPKVEGRRKVIEKLAAGLSMTDRKQPRLRSRKAWFSTIQSDVINANGRIRVQLLGVEIAHLTLDPAAQPKPRYLFYPKPDVFSKIFGSGAKIAAGPWCWSHNKKDAVSINKFLEACEKHPGAKPDNEREVQWQLAHALRIDKTGELRWLRPVTWNNLFTEIGVSIGRSGSLGEKPGNIDLVVRRGRTPKDRGFLVFELKKPGETGVKAALIQAVHYALALDFEANDGFRTSMQHYRAVLGAKKEDAPLRIGAVAVLEDDDGGVVRRTALEFLPSFWAERGDSRIDRIGILLYKFDREKKRVTSWKWLPDWDASKLTPALKPKSG